MIAKKKFVVAITGVKNLGSKNVSIITYLSPVFSCVTMEEAVGKAIVFFHENNPGYEMFNHVENEI